MSPAVSIDWRLLPSCRNNVDDLPNIYTNDEGNLGTMYMISLTLSPPLDTDVGQGGAVEEDGLQDELNNQD